MDSLGETAKFIHRNTRSWPALMASSRALPEVTYLSGLEELAPNDRNTLNKANHTGICSKSGRHPAAGLTPRSL